MVYAIIGFLILECLNVLLLYLIQVQSVEMGLVFLQLGKNQSRILMFMPL